MSAYTGTETIAKAIGMRSSDPTFIEVVDVKWDDKYDPDAPLTLAGKLRGRFLDCIPARLRDAAKGYVAIVDDRITYTGQTSNFTVGDTITGGTSGATGTLVYDEDAGATGRLTLKDVVGRFVTGEALTDEHTGDGTAAVVDPAVRVYVVNTSTKVLDECAKDVDLSGVLVRIPCIVY
jgi:hypothetical protein